MAMTNMESVSRAFIFRQLRVLIALAAIGWVISLGSIRAQDKPITNKTPIFLGVRQESANILDAVKVIGFRIDGVSYVFPPKYALVRFDISQGWLDRFEVITKNVSPKTLIAANLQITCEDVSHKNDLPPNTLPPFFAIQLTLGRMPDRFRPVNLPASAPPLPQTAAAISIAPQGELVFMAKDMAERDREAATKLPTITFCFVGLRFALFSDGTMYQMNGQFVKPDPASDYGYVKMTPEEFGMNPSPNTAK